MHLVMLSPNAYVRQMRRGDFSGVGHGALASQPCSQRRRPQGWLLRSEMQLYLGGGTVRYFYFLYVFLFFCHE